MRNWEQLENIVACPFTREPLRRLSETSVGTASGHSFPLVNGVPILRHGPAAEIKDPNHVSNPVPPAFKEMMLTCPGKVLFLGAGASDFRDERIIEVEYHLFRNTDVAADAHWLPFRAGVFKLVVALNVFEHLREPHIAAAELHRVLAPGGRVIIHTAFLQPLHEEPHHYYDATEFGVREWFRGFSNVEVNVSPNFNPYYGIAWLMYEMLHLVEAHLGPDARRTLEGVTVSEIATGWAERRDPRSPVLDILSKLPRDAQARFAAGFELIATR